LSRFQFSLQSSFNDEQRRNFMDRLGEAGSDYRWNLYNNGFASELVYSSASEIVKFLDLAQQYVEHSLRANARSDNLYHSYNILHLDNDRASISHLYEMLEGQVAILSSGLLSSNEALALLQSLRNSALYQEEQQSYILYPDRTLPGFLQKNCLTHNQIADVALFEMLLEAHDQSIITRDVNGVYHFSGHIRNFNDVSRALDVLKRQPRYAELIESETEKIKALFEATFHHDEFTGRSGTFFAYEGLGSVYWHMVAKLLLAVQETAIRSRDDSTAEALRQCYRDIRQGLSFNKSPDVYGAFPTDPYSHTPKGQGAKQPGMTGLVKEVMLSRHPEIGFCVEDGKLVFDTTFLDRHELLTDSATFSYIDVYGHKQELELKAGSLAYSICQTPIVLQRSSNACISVYFEDGSVHNIDGHVLDDVTSRHIFQRSGAVRYLTVSVLFDPFN
jgi:hypothetical protein